MRIDNELTYITYKLHIIERKLDVLLVAEHAVLRGIAELLERIPENNFTNAIAVVFTGGMVENNVLVFDVGQTATASIVPLLADGVTNSGGVVSNVTYSFNDPSATVVVNNDGVTALCTGVAASNGPITGTATCTVTDTDGVVSQWTQTFTIQTNGVQQQQLTQSVAVQFAIH